MWANLMSAGGIMGVLGYTPWCRQTRLADAPADGDRCTDATQSNSARLNIVGTPTLDYPIGLTRILQSKLFRIDSSDVPDFLRTHPEVAEGIWESLLPISNLFGGGAPLILRVVHDHDSDDGDRLVVAIQTRLGVDKARALRKQFFRNWWNDRSELLGRYLGFSLEYA